MSINPAQGIGPANEAQFANGEPRHQQPVPSSSEGAISAQPDPGITAEGNPRPVTTSPEAQPDEVQVQQDSEIKDEIIIRYVNPAGNVILQIPSSQVLGVQRAIDQVFQQETKARASAGATPTGSKGGKTHGH
jgi:hypothetical protein